MILCVICRNNEHFLMWKWTLGSRGFIVEITIIHTTPWTRSVKSRGISSDFEYSPINHKDQVTVNIVRWFLMRICWDFCALPPVLLSCRDQSTGTYDNMMASACWQIASCLISWVWFFGILLLIRCCWLSLSRSIVIRRYMGRCYLGIMESAINSSSSSNAIVTWGPVKSNLMLCSACRSGSRERESEEGRLRGRAKKRR